MNEHAKWMVAAACLWAVLHGALPAQTTEGIIAGRVYDQLSGYPIPLVKVSYTQYSPAGVGIRSDFACTDVRGFYTLPLLSPGKYSLRAERGEDCRPPDARAAAVVPYQAKEIHELELGVGTRLDINIPMRPLSDVWGARSARRESLSTRGAIVHFYAADVLSLRSALVQPLEAHSQSTEPALSAVVDAQQLRELPLHGRDVYSMLVTQPGVTADAATARGLGLSASGQRPSASNFLLDGLENNNYLVTGPLTTTAPEAVQEYRVSTNNFAAEYGRTSGFLANAVTRPGGSQWHGSGYFNLKNEVLNANAFQWNARGWPRPPAKEIQPGYHVGGPGPGRTPLFVSSAWDWLRSRSRGESEQVMLPTAALAAAAPAGSLARSLLERFPAPVGAAGPERLAPATLAPPVSLDRGMALQRVDYHAPQGRHRLMGRYSLARLSRPDFLWTPYKEFSSGLKHSDDSLAVRLQSTFSSRFNQEARLGWGRDDLRWDRPHPEIPTLALASPANVRLPGSPAFYAYRNRNRSWEAAHNVLWTGGRHIAKFGGGLLLRRLDGFLSAGRDGYYLFQSLEAFRLDRPYLFGAVRSRREAPANHLPDYDRQYRWSQFSLFAQDAIRLRPRLIVNLGVRYESFGAPRNVGREQDAVVELAPGASFPERLVGARLRFPGQADQSLYRPDRNDWAARVAVSYDWLGNARALLRAAYGVFYDRPFDNLWQNVRANNFELGWLFWPSDRPVNYLQPVSNALQSVASQVWPGDFPKLTLVDPGLRTAYVHSFLFGVRAQLTPGWTAEVNALGSLGRKLITTDLVNRLGSRGAGLGQDSRYNPSLPDISYRGNQGVSSYCAAALTARYRTASRGLLAVAYTWGHTIDNQSEPLAGDFFDLSFTGRSAAAEGPPRAAFARQFDSRADRGNSDFDQRHNLVFFSLWRLPDAFSGTWLWKWFRDWRFSQLAAFRTGFPYTVLAASSGAILNNRADLSRPQYTPAPGDQAAPGGRRLLDAAAFRQPAAGRLGNTGRNAFRGPGMLSADISLSRSVPLRRLGEAGRITIRADVYNLLNHANLNNPDSLLKSPPSPTFGIASFGRRGRAADFPALMPFEEIARQVQLLLSLEF